MNNDEIKSCLKNVAMQVAAMSEVCIYVMKYRKIIKEHEKEILLAQAKNDPKNPNKPENIIEKMIIGRLQQRDEKKSAC